MIESQNPHNVHGSTINPEEKFPSLQSPTDAEGQETNLAETSESIPQNRTVLTSSHLLASNYVPNNLKAINETPVSTFIPTTPPPTMEADQHRVFCGLVGVSRTTATNQYNRANTFPRFQCYCSNVTGQRCVDPPKVVRATKEAEFAADRSKKRVQEWMQRKEDSRTIGDDGTTIPSIGNDMIPGSREQKGTTQHYLATFRELLQVEYEEIHRLYDRAYAQYKIKIVSPYNSPGGVAKLKVMGISDGRPSVRPGDMVRVRPHSPILVYNTYNNNTFSQYDGSYNHTVVPDAINGVYSQYHQPTQNYYPPKRSKRKEMIEVVGQVLEVKAAKDPNPNTKKTGKPKRDTILISWIIPDGISAYIDTQIKRNFCTVRFLPSQDSHERCLTALDWLRTIDPAVARDLLFPSKVPKLPLPLAIDESEIDPDTTEEIEYEQLNQNQARFVQMVLTRSAYPLTTRGIRPPMVLTGPAGTGKTKTILAAILQVLRLEDKICPGTNSTYYRPRILICTPSHTACDVITQRLVGLLKQKNSKNTSKISDRVLRLFDASRPIETVPIQVLPYTCQNETGGNFALPDPHELLQYSVIICTCHDAHVLFRAGFTNASLRQRRQCFATDVVRQLSASGLELKGSIEGHNVPHFTHFFLDEAAQATEPETLIPLSVVVDDHPDVAKVEIALCGDPRQLGPSIYSPKALAGLQRSLLERLLRLPTPTYGGGKAHLMGPHTADSKLTLDEMIEYSFQTVEYRQHLSVFLNRSYRGHPSFLYMPSKLFYFDKLQSSYNGISTRSDERWIQAVRAVESLPDVKEAFPESPGAKAMDWPMIFYGVHGKCTSIAVETFFGSHCWCNEDEARAVVKIIRAVVKTGVSTASVGVMAAFRAQVVRIRKVLRAAQLGSVNVGLVEDYQSMERDVIILSLTRSNNSLVKADVDSGEGLFHQPKRMNVALTRAEQMLVVVGNPNIMIEDPCWAEWLEFCKHNHLWYCEKKHLRKVEKN